MMIKRLASILLVFQCLLSSAFSMEKGAAVNEMEKLLRGGNSSNMLSQVLANPLLRNHLSQLSGLSEEQLLSASQGRTLQDMFNVNITTDNLADFEQ